MPTISAFKIAKQGNLPLECEDDFYFLGTSVFVISDGASEAVFSREWSNTLVHSVSSHLPSEFTSEKIRQWFKALLPTLYQTWEEQIPAYDTLPWHGQHKFKRGSSSTLLFMHLTLNHYQAFAVGDSCLFHIRDHELLKTFPISASDEFGTHPYLIHTQEGIPDSEEALQILESDYQPGDCFLMATDALSAWLIKEHETGTNPWSRILEITDQLTLDKLVAELRATSMMRNDDVVLLRVVTDPITQGTPLQSFKEAAASDTLECTPADLRNELDQKKLSSEPY